MENEWIRDVCSSLPPLSSSLCSSAPESWESVVPYFEAFGHPTQALVPSGASGENAHSVLALYHLHLFNVPVSELHGSRWVQVSGAAPVLGACE